MSDTPRHAGEDDAAGQTGAGRPTHDDAAAPVSGPPAPAGAAGPEAEAVSSPAGPSAGFFAGSAAGSDPADAGGRGHASAGGDPADGTASAAADSASAAGGGQAGSPVGRRSRRRPGRGLFGWAAVPSGPLDARRRRWFVAAISVGAAIIVIALCAGALSVISTIDGVRDQAADAREARHQRDLGCLELEKRLNRLTPPGATANPAARATAVRDENAAVRIYVGELRDQRSQDAWRQLLDARTVFADALDRQAKSRTPAFYVAPRAADGRAVTDQLVDLSPSPCGGPIRRLAAPEL